jgi:hypothetical protein
MTNIVEMERPKPASSPEVVEFLRELLLLAYEQRIELCIVGVATTDEREANGVYTAGTTIRDIERLQDIIDSWVGEIEYEAEDD